MNFALGETQVIQGFGLPAAIVIIALAGALLFTVKLLLKSYDQRITDAKDFGNKIVEPLESLRIMNQRQADLSEKMYEILLDSKRRT